jgi:hypothetical protein
MDIRGELSRKWNKTKLVLQNVGTLILIDRFMFFFLSIGAIGAIFLSNGIGYLVTANIFTLIGVVIGHKKYPKFTIAYILGIIFLSSISLGMMFPSEKYQIVGVGLTLLLVVLTFWYASIMLHQIKIMNNEKLGKVISEIARSIFSPLRNELIEIQEQLKTGRYVSTILPSKLNITKKGEELVKKYTKGQIEIRPTSTFSEPKNPIKRSASRLLKIDDEDLVYAMALLNDDNTQFVENIYHLNNLHTQFDSDLLPYWIPFKEECKRLIELPNNQPYLTTDFSEDDYKIVLKYSFIQQDYSPYHPNILPGKQEELPRFISENGKMLLIWLQNVPTLKNDMDNIEQQRVKIIVIIAKMLGRITYLLSHWKMTYYLTEEELEEPEFSNAV